MSLITRCPACATCFRVLPDQLRLADGWVRCGRCSEVFDAQQALQPQQVAPGLQPAAQSAPATSAPTELADASLSFLQQTAPACAPTPPWVRFGLAVGCAGAAGLLVMQLAVQERDWLVAQVPALRPALEAVCVPLGCTLSPLRRIDAVVIDASGLSQLRDRVYRLQLALSNRAALALAVPAIELTLTDAADQPLVRRVILPAELGDASVLAGGAQWSTQLVFSVADSAKPIAGYRVLAFYP